MVDPKPNPHQGYFVRGPWVHRRVQLVRSVDLCQYRQAQICMDHMGHGFSEGLVAHLSISILWWMSAFSYAESLGGAIALLIMLRHDGVVPIKPFDGAKIQTSMLTFTRMDDIGDVSDEERDDDLESNVHGSRTARRCQPSPTTNQRSPRSHQLSCDHDDLLNQLLHKVERLTHQYEELNIKVDATHLHLERDDMQNYKGIHSDEVYGILGAE
ncbi:caffeoylshikimate esterase [Forsythia ovata]|uniref:Caffeoylshikimate esterase n=1 Tax=Forsythia ovata TaxID=205694 RepID=A0ABD1UUY0_9LAMI